MLAQALLLPIIAALLGSARPTSKSLSKRFSGVEIVSGRDGHCLIAAPKTSVGSEVTSAICGSTAWATLWDIDEGSGSVLLHGTDLALDAGDDPSDGGALKVWTSYPGLYQQTWYLTPDNRIAITGGTHCLDEGDEGAQIWTCTTGDDNQVWYIRNADGTSPTSSSSTSASVSTVQITASAV